MSTSTLAAPSASAPTQASVVTPAHLEAFERDGFFLLENVVPAEHLQMLRDKVMYHIGRMDGIMAERGVDRLNINHKGSRYFVSAFKTDPELGDFIFSDLMAQITRATLGDDVFLFYEQYVVKAAEKGGKFAWHQDSGYVGHPNHKPYLTCWVTLDDVTEENGTVYMLPYDRAGTREWVEHVYDESAGDKVGYFGDDPGVPVLAPAGSIACFSSLCFHKSGPNQTDRMRRVYLPQYSPEPLLKNDGSGPWALAEPFIQGGQRVRFGA